jgi:hypothetical protein
MTLWCSEWTMMATLSSTTNCLEIQNS